MRQLPLSQGRSAMIDDEDYAQLSRSRWFFSGGYAVHWTKEDGRRRLEYLHRVVMDTPSWLEAINLNGDRLDCRRANLRVVTTGQSRCRYRRRRTSASGYRGVYWHRAKGKWCASIRHEWRLTNLGRFDTPEEAARAYDRAARKLHGDMAAVNFPEEADALADLALQAPLPTPSAGRCRGPLPE